MGKPLTLYIMAQWIRQIWNLQSCIECWLKYRELYA